MNIKFNSSINVVIIGFVIFIVTHIGLGCAQIGMPTGGPKDTLAPKLVRATPTNGSKNVNGNKITLEFNEYIDVQELQKNLIISPLQNKNPIITNNPKSIVIKFKDSLLPNTTYTINFGDAIKDVNEGNAFKNLNYTFSTGNIIDSLSIAGRVIMAETGEIDSTLLVMLYRKATDSTVTKKKPNYIAKVSSDGSFEFNNLPNDSFKIYALKDGDGGKTYNSTSETFAFFNTNVLSNNSEFVNLFAYVEKKEIPIDKTNTTKPSSKSIAEKKLKIMAPMPASQDLLQPLEISFNKPLKSFDSSKIHLTDTSYKKISNVSFLLDSTAQKIYVNAKWTPETRLFLIIDTLAVKDSVGNRLAKNDTLKFVTKRLEDYGKVILHFNNLDISTSPVVQFFSGEILKYSSPILLKDWANNMFIPGDYTVRILYDTNNDGKWTTGNYTKKLQPELANTLPQKLSVKADWDNERDINL